MNSRTRIIMYFNQCLTLTGHITGTSHYLRYFVIIFVEMLCVTYFTMNGTITLETCSYRTAECERRVNETVTLERVVEVCCDGSTMTSDGACEPVGTSPITSFHRRRNNIIYSHLY